MAFIICYLEAKEAAAKRLVKLVNIVSVEVIYVLISLLIRISALLEGIMTKGVSVQAMLAKSLPNKIKGQKLD